MRSRICAVILFMTALLEGVAGETASAFEFPFEFREGLIWLKVETRESDTPLNFLLDTGASVSVINLPTAQKLGLKGGRRVKVQGVHSKTAGYWPLHLSAAANAVPLPRDFLAVDLSDLSRACKCRVDGLLGADFFRKRVVQIDFEARKVRLLPSMESVPDEFALPLRVTRGGMLAAVRVNGGGTNWVRLDTGCASAFHWVTSGAQSKAMSRRVAVALTEVEIPLTETSVQLAGWNFDSVATGIHEKAIFPGEAGLLGNGLLSRFKSVTVDAASGRLMLEGLVRSGQGNIER
jgi:hypothetical protein